MLLGGYAMVVSALDTVPTEATLNCQGNPSNVSYKFELPDEFNFDRTQVYPVPGGTKDVDVYIVACDPNGNSDIKTVRAMLNWTNNTKTETKTAAVATLGSSCTSGKQALKNATDAGLLTLAECNEILDTINIYKLCKLYKATFTLDNCDTSGWYHVTATACDDCGCGCVPETNSFFYKSIVAVDIDFTKVNYGPISVGNPQTVPGNSIMQTPGVALPVLPTVQNIGNDPMDVIISATDMAGSCGGVPVSIPASAQTAKVDGEPKQALSTTGVCFDTNLMCEMPAPIEFVLTAPAGTCTSTYTGSLTVTGTKTCTTTP